MDFWYSNEPLPNPQQLDNAVEFFQWCETKLMDKSFCHKLWPNDFTYYHEKFKETHDVITMMNSFNMPHVQLFIHKLLSVYQGSTDFHGVMSFLTLKYICNELLSNILPVSNRKYIKLSTNEKEELLKSANSDRIRDCENSDILLQ